MVNRFQSRVRSDNRWVFIKAENAHLLTKEQVNAIIADLKKHGTTR